MGKREVQRAGIIDEGLTGAYRAETFTGRMIPARRIVLG